MVISGASHSQIKPSSPFGPDVKVHMAGAAALGPGIRGPCVALTQRSQRLLWERASASALSVNVSPVPLLASHW